MGYHTLYISSDLQQQSVCTSFTMTIRTSDSLNEGLPIKMTREKFQRNDIFSMKKDSSFNPRIIHKSRFLIGQVTIEKYGLKTLFLLFNI